jgi:hypothetical protein
MPLLNHPYLHFPPLLPRQKDGKDSFPPEVIPLLASLLSLPHPDGYPALHLSPQRQKQKTQEALVNWLLVEAERQPVYCP